MQSVFNNSLIIQWTVSSVGHSGAILTYPISMTKFLGVASQSNTYKNDEIAITNRFYNATGTQATIQQSWVGSTSKGWNDSPFRYIIIGQMI